MEISACTVFYEERTTFSGRREVYSFQVLEYPPEGIEQALVIAGCTQGIPALWDSLRYCNLSG